MKSLLARKPGTAANRKARKDAFLLAKAEHVKQLYSK